MRKKIVWVEIESEYVKYHSVSCAYGGWWGYCEIYGILQRPACFRHYPPAPIRPATRGEIIDMLWDAAENEDREREHTRRLIPHVINLARNLRNIGFFTKRASNRFYDRHGFLPEYIVEQHNIHIDDFHTGERPTPLLCATYIPTVDEDENIQKWWKIEREYRYGGKKPSNASQRNRFFCFYKKQA